jgi:type IV secretory pathway VirB2 component (pilin)
VTTIPIAIARRERAVSIFALVLPLLIFVLAIAFPGLAFAAGDAASQLSSKATSALDWIKTAVYFILVVSVIGSGVMAAFGRLSWMTVGTVLAGAIIAGIGAEVVTALYGGPSS